MDKIYIYSIKEIENEFEYFISFLDEASKEYILNHKNHQARLQILLDRLLALKYLNTTIFKYNEYKKPYIDNLYFNISHSNDYVVLIVSDDEVGIDIETNRNINEKLIDYVLNEEEKKTLKDNNDFIKIWTKKESIVKCLGTGINTKLKYINTIDNDKLIKINDTNLFLKTINYDNYYISFCKKSIINDYNLEYISADDLIFSRDL